MISVKKKKIRYLYYVLSFVLLCNLPPVKWVFAHVVDEAHYRYSNISGSCTMVQDLWKGGRFEGLQAVQLECRAYVNDSIMYRLFKRNVFCFWRWLEYGFDSRYNIPYKEWDEIRKYRNDSIVTKKNCKTF